MTPTHDQARQFGKAYVGALNTGAGEFAALFAPGAEVRVDGAGTDPDGVRAATPPGRSGFRGARVDGEWVVLTVRVIDRAAGTADDRRHRLQMDDAGRIARLEA